MVPTRSFPAALCLAALACGQEGAARQPGRSAYRLAAVGAADLVLHPGETRTVRVVLAEDQVGGVVHALVHFELAGDPATVTVGAQDAATGPDGVASVAVTAGARTATVGLIASAPGFDVAEVEITLEVVPVRKLLRILDAAGTQVDQGGLSASVTLAGSSTAALRVREIDGDTGAPLAGDTILFALPDGVRSSFAGTGGKSARATTNQAGEAQAFLVAAAEEPGFEASAFPAEGGEAVYFSVAVLGGRPPPDPPACTPEDASCPPVCDPACPPGTHCEAATHGCAADPPELPDVTGVWYTKHVFGIRESLPPALQAVFTAIRIVDQLLSGRLGLPSWLQAVLDSVLQQFLPGWFYALVRVADDAATVLSYLRAEGKMRLSPAAGAAHVRGTEVWTSLVFYWLPLCGEHIRGDPEVPPDCARLDLATTDSDSPFISRRCRDELLPAVAVQAAPFTATVEPVPGSVPARYQLVVGPRSVDVQMTRAVVSEVDLLLSLATPWHCIAEATDCRGGRECIVDCAGAGQWVSDFTSGFFDRAVIENACAGAVGLLGEQAAQLLGSIRFKTDALRFTGRAAIGEVGDDDSVCRSETRCAGRLGIDSFDGDLRHRTPARDGAWTGAFLGDALQDMPGAWEAKRTYFQ